MMMLNCNEMKICFFVLFPAVCLVTGCLRCPAAALDWALMTFWRSMEVGEENRELPSSFHCGRMFYLLF